MLETYLLIGHNLIIEMIDVDRFSSMRGSEGLEESALEFATKLSDVLARVFPNDHHLSH
jgi:hypothetical protein